MIFMSGFLSFVPRVLLLVITLSLLSVIYLLMRKIGLKLKDYLVLWVFRLLEVIVLGGYLGDHAGCVQYVSDKVWLWVTNLCSLTKVAVKEPQAAYAALTKSFQNEWTFLQRVVAGCDHAFLEYTLFSQFLPVLFGCEITPSECQLFSLPTRLGGLGILDPTTSASRFYQASMHVASILSAAIREGSTLDLGLHVTTDCVNS